MQCFSPYAVSIAPDRRQSKTLILSTNVDKKSLGTESSTAIYRPNGDMQSKTLFPSILTHVRRVVRGTVLGNPGITRSVTLHERSETECFTTGYEDEMEPGYPV